MPYSISHPTLNKSQQYIEKLKKIPQLFTETETLSNTFFYDEEKVGLSFLMMKIKLSTKGSCSQIDEVRKKVCKRYALYYRERLQTAAYIKLLEGTPQLFKDTLLFTKPNELSIRHEEPTEKNGMGGTILQLIFTLHEKMKEVFAKIYETVTSFCELYEDFNIDNIELELQKLPYERIDITFKSEIMQMMRNNTEIDFLLSVIKDNLVQLLKVKEGETKTVVNINNINMIGGAGETKNHFIFMLNYYYYTFVEELTLITSITFQNLKYLLKSHCEILIFLKEVQYDLDYKYVTSDDCPKQIEENYNKLMNLINYMYLEDVIDL